MLVEVDAGGTEVEVEKVLLAEESLAAVSLPAGVDSVLPVAGDFAESTLDSVFEVSLLVDDGIVEDGAGVLVVGAVDSTAFGAGAGGCVAVGVPAGGFNEGAAPLGA